MKISFAIGILCGFIVTIIGNLLAATLQESWRREGFDVGAGLRRIILLVPKWVAAIALLLALVFGASAIDREKEWWDRWSSNMSVKKDEPPTSVEKGAPPKEPGPCPPRGPSEGKRKRKQPARPTQKRATPAQPTNDTVVAVAPAVPEAIPAPSSDSSQSWVLLDTRWEWISPILLQRCLYWVRCEDPHQCEAFWTCT